MKQRRARNPMAGAITVLSVLVGLLVAVFVLGFVVKGGSFVYPNVIMCGVEIGGKSTAEAKRLVEDKVRSTYGVTDMVVTLPDRTVVLPADKVKVSLDYDYAMKKAQQYGREGNIIAAMFSWLECRETSYNVDISSAFVMDMDYIRSVAADTAAAVKKDMQDSSLVYDPNTHMLRVTVGVCGVSLDEQLFITTVKDAYSKGQFEATVDYDRTLYNPVDIAGFYLQNCTPVRDAAYIPETHEFVEEIIGFGFDLEAAQQQVNMAKEGETLVFRLETILPQVYLEQLKGAMFKDLIAECHTNHTKDDERTTNLILSTAAINGTILNPGEVFSFNGVVGERTAAKGYRNGIVFSGGQSERGLGGGVCQVASTLYMTTLLADLEIVERTEHMFTVDYLPLGMDATVHWGTNLDYRFRNSMKNPIMILCNVEDGAVHVYFYGIDDRGYTVDMTYEVLSTTAWKDEYIQDNTKPVGYKEVKTTPYTGYRVVTYKSRVDASGNKISTVRMDDSTYSVRNRQTIVGPETAQVADPTAPVAPTTPTQPTTSTTQPLTPTQPEKPAETTKPAEPEKPAETTKPTEPEKPAETTKPTEPEKPAETTKPTEPEKPAEPQKPAETPSTPSNPMVAPATPGNLMPDIELNN